MDHNVKTLASGEYSCSCGAIFDRDEGDICPNAPDCAELPGMWEPSDLSGGATDCITPFVSSSGESRNPIYEGQFDGETPEQAEARRHWSKVGMELAREVDAVHGCTFCGSDEHMTAVCPIRGDERAAFEAWYETTYGISLEPEFRANHFIGYVNDKANHRWTAWQARAALSAPSHGDKYRDLVWMAHQLADMVLKGDAPHTAVRVAKSLMRECEGKSSAPSHGEQVREAVDTFEGMSEEAKSTVRGMVDYCLNARVCLGMDEGFKSFDPEIEHDFVIELHKFAAAPSAGSHGGDV